jgi:ribosomal protein L10
MDANDAVWLLPGEGEKSAGPYTTDQVVEQWRAAKITVATLCWREGMPEWRPVSQVPILREAIERAEAAQRARTLRMVAIGGAVAVVVIAAAMALVLLGEPREITEAKGALASGQYTDAAQTLLAYVRDKPRNGEALYLLGVALVNDYASTPAKEFTLSADEGKLQTASKAFARAFELSPSWRRVADTEVAQALERVPASAPDAFERVLAMESLRKQLGLAQPTVLAQELVAKLSALTQPGHYGSHVDEAVAQAMSWDRSRTGEVARFYLQLGKAALPSRPADAAAALDKALKYDPSLEKTDDGCLAILELTPEPSAAKLARCQSFLAARPDSARRAQVLLVVVDDALKSNQRGSWAWGRDQTKAYLDAGLEAAGELKTKFPSTPGVAVKIEALVDAIGTIAEQTKAQADKDRAKQGVKVLLNTPDVGKVKPKIIRAAYGNLPEDLVEVAERVEEDLKIMGLTEAGAVGLLAQNPKSVQVVDVSCQRAEFTSDQVEGLRRWVAGGGILWCRNDVLSLFQIAFTHSYGFQETCEVAVMPEMCPVVTGCKTVQVSAAGYEHGRVTDLKARAVIPLLRGRGHAYWSLIPYGKGWISNVPHVDVEKYDGARMWLNFRLFCLRRPIPGAPLATPGTEGVPGETGVGTGGAGGEPLPPPKPPPPAGPAKRTLTVRAKSPEGATVAIQATPNDLEGKGGGAPLFTLTYTDGTLVELTAPETVAGRKFVEWSGADSAAGTKATLMMRANRQVTALYDLAEVRQSVANWSGQWQTVEFGQVELKQEGDKITGSYHEGAGRINGTAVGEKSLQMEWSEGQLLSQLHRWRLETDGNSFAGAWRNKGAPLSAETTYKGVRRVGAQKP